MPYKEITIEEVYARDSKLKKEDVTALLEWKDKQYHLPEITELQAALFLHSCYYSNEAAKATIDTYFTVRTLCPDIFGLRTLNHKPLEEAIDTAVLTALPKKTPSGDTVILGRLMDPNSAHYNPPEQCKMFDVITLINLHEKGPMNGVQIVIDMSQSTFGHFIKVSPVLMKKLLYYLQEGMPIRLKKIHLINIASFVDKVLALVKPFMKKELFDSLAIHSDIKTLYTDIPQDILPAEYGGSCDSFTVIQDQLKNKLREYESLLKFQENQLVDESKRQGARKNAEDLFGVEGSFKKLEVD
ncbi:alpha-tocopherol transfer protein-like [Diabrotica virgifera virgifera]|uniref:Alpha-tocopherol transfer protein-like n=1 Tax=Diabrotica virgifera virgifera TaxID=50390 RepID=A0A6P7GH94_DIAVI|nr:alpha-tocopherol transfer protein-like [Diabrotica virgifera virgifera]XP_050502669.1 alpha-tocopherol transfer protein-like [Diabrotica virgifera virgifera]